jgi:hypothetical protein
MTAFDKKQMDAMVNRFLGWKLPETFGPDCYVSFDKAKAQAKHGWPVGTNLLTADEARAMLEYVLDVTFIPDWSLLEATQSSLREHMRAIRLLMAAGHVTQEKVDQAFKLAANLKWPDGVPACQPPADKIATRLRCASAKTIPRSGAPRSTARPAAKPATTPTAASARCAASASPLARRGRTVADLCPQDRDWLEWATDRWLELDSSSPEAQRAFERDIPRERPPLVAARSASAAAARCAAATRCADLA